MRYMSLHYVGLKISLVLIIALFIAGNKLVAQDIHSYIDDQGVMHFVDDESLIPEKYKGRSKSVIKKEIESQPVMEEKQETKPKGDIKGIEIKKDKFGNTASYWRARYKALRMKRYQRKKNSEALNSKGMTLLKN